MTQAPTPEDFELPARPKPFQKSWIYTDAQMQAYARACLLAFSEAQKGHANIGVVIDRDGALGHFTCDLTQGHTPFIGDTVYSPHPPSVKAEDKVDADRLDFLETHHSTVFSLGADSRPTWYSRAGRNSPHQRRATLREAIDAAIAANKDST